MPIPIPIQIPIQTEVRGCAGESRFGGRIAAALALALATLGCAGGSAPDSEPAGLMLVGGSLYASPDSEPLADSVVRLRGGKIAAVGGSELSARPPGVAVLDCAGGYVVAGFQNSHVHFSEPKWSGAGAQPAARLSAELEAMALRWGFTTVVDLGSDLATTLALRRRVDTGEVEGPRILTAGTPLYPGEGIPFQLRESLSPEVLRSLHMPATAAEARALVEAQLGAGADVLKLFTGSWGERGKVKPMSPAVASTAVQAAHRRGRLVFAHASNVAGLEVALDAGADVLAHALDDGRGFEPSHGARMNAGRMAMVPTLQLFAGRPNRKDVLRRVRDFAAAGGWILFGTDVGYLSDYDPTREYELMGEAGLGWRQILASLTVNAAQRLREGAVRGRVAPGMDADLVVLASDPAEEVRAFADVRYVIRQGRVVYRAPRQRALTPARPTG